MIRLGERSGSTWPPMVLAVGVAIAFGVLAAAASAAQNVTTQNGVTYVSTFFSSTVGNNLRDSITSECQNDISPLSGGFHSGGGYNETAVTGSIPVNVNLSDADFDGWSGAWRGSPSTAFILETLAICDETKPAYVTDTLKLKPGTRKTVTLDCKGTRHVYGGGLGSEILEPGPLLISSYPVDSKADNDKTPDDGWRLSADNEAAGKVLVSAYAICGKAKPVYKSSATTVPAGSSGLQNADCPDGKPTVIGGGQKVSGGYATSILHTSYAPGPYHEWTAAIDNFSLDTEKLQTYAVCVGDQLQ